ncbi:MAG: pyridoxal phosphate-dependent aminotransferase [Bacillota bacterium]|jgi:aspartate/methionine/tyrosine aminotransferase|nr:pyridoxal phosphate-dependent aminotransferase [Eubacteriales bacterium]MDI9492369.1 pyridoxal phosphate-dependent aminotransferase [Bacillota bacterium]NLV69624.1 pyridoxal phosphate-dependent aminotransferase [Clostridiales bacterium]MDD3537728.1 pyridoxal phosphate-dependent aminotransferase [Eubacteriales bacterium]MDD4285522.1 pyridoxal phosphate-dependent aminotransferase [Eubacteriales bacterium]
MAFKQAERLENVHHSQMRKIFGLCNELRKRGEPVADVTLGQPNFPTPQYIKDACVQALQEGHTGYADYSGIPILKEEIIKKIKRDTGMDYGPDEILATTGVAQGCFVSLMSFLNPGDEILLPDPVYFIYDNCAHIAGAAIKKYTLKEENEFQVDIDELKSLITEKTKMMVIVSPSNPLGASLTTDNLSEIAALAVEHDLIVVTDEIYDMLVYEDPKPVSIATFPGMRERTIILNGFSKSFAMTGWRLGWAAGPEYMIDPMNRLAFYMTSGPTTFVMHAAAAALRDEDGSCEMMRKEFDKRRRYLVEEINKLETFSCLAPKGAFYIFLNIKKTGMSSQEFCEYIFHKYSIAVIAGNIFGSSGEGFVRISYAACDETLKAVVDGLQKADKDF